MNIQSHADPRWTLKTSTIEAQNVKETGDINICLLILDLAKLGFLTLRNERSPPGVEIFMY